MKKTLLITVAVNLFITTAAIAFGSSLINKEFPDVKTDAYYYNAVKNMTNAAYMNGYSNGNFGPNDYITRGQAAMILDTYNTRNYAHIENKISNTELQNLYGLSFVCPDEKLFCHNMDDVAESVGCDNTEYVKWVDDNCSL